jgi:hypothetical protein
METDGATLIEELYVQGDRGLIDLILRLERRRIEAAQRLGALDLLAEPNVGQAPQAVIVPAGAQAA